jgi:hypothetical protein
VLDGDRGVHRDGTGLDRSRTTVPWVAMTKTSTTAMRKPGPAWASMRGAACAGSGIVNRSLLRRLNRLTWAPTAPVPEWQT